MPTIEEIETARDSVRDLLDIEEVGFGQFCELQKVYFKLEFMRLARSPGFEGESFDASRYNISDGTFRTLEGVSVPDPTNPFTTHAVTIDHVVDGDAGVACEVNGVPVEEVGSRPGSHIR